MERMIPENYLLRHRPDTNTTIGITVAMNNHDAREA